MSSFKSAHREQPTTTNLKFTGGTLKGRKIIAPHSSVTHPMGARERLALFNSLQSDLPGATVLDAFAGTGALGLEALSRGAAHATFIEKHHLAAATLRQNITSLGLSAQTTLVENSVENFQSDHKFDLIFADPPYDKISTSALVHLASFLAPAGQLIISHPADFNLAELAKQANLQLRPTKAYAAARLTIAFF